MDKAIRSWAPLATNPAYAKHPLAAEALLRMGDHLIKSSKQAEVGKAVEFLRKVGRDSRFSQRDAAREALEILSYHLIRRQPNEAELREVYAESKGLSSRPRKKTPKVATHAEG